MSTLAKMAYDNLIGYDKHGNDTTGPKHIEEYSFEKETIEDGSTLYKFIDGSILRISAGEIISVFK